MGGDSTLFQLIVSITIGAIFIVVSRILASVKAIQADVRKRNHVAEDMAAHMLAMARQYHEQRKKDEENRGSSDAPKPPDSN